MPGRGLFSQWVERLWTDAEIAYRAKILAALPVNRSAVLLDIGCEDGAWTEQVRKKVGIPPERVLALELVPELAEIARGRGFDVRTGDVDAPWPFDDRSVDIVHANQVIEHVLHIDHFVKEIKRVLVPGGLAVVCTENLASWHNIAALVIGYQPFSLTNISNKRSIGNPFALHKGAAPVGESFQHVHVLTLTALRDLFSAYGLPIEEAWGTGYHPLPHRLAAGMAAIDPRHAHFVGLVARAA